MTQERLLFSTSCCLQRKKHTVASSKLQMSGSNGRLRYFAVPRVGSYLQRSRYQPCPFLFEDELETSEYVRPARRLTTRESRTKLLADGRQDESVDEQ